VSAFLEAGRFWHINRETDKLLAMSNPASIFDIVDEDAKRRAIEEGIADIEAGRHVDREIVDKWLERLARGEFEAPPPLSTTKP
jgi:predicted transcriptional regulator